MKKIICIAVCFAALLSFIVSLANNVTLYLDGNEVFCSPPPCIIDGRTFIPARAVFQEMGAKIDWDGEKKQVTVDYNDIKIEMTIGSKVSVVNGEKISSEVAPLIISDRTMIPLRFVGETLKANVFWDEKNYAAHVESPKKEETPKAIVGDIACKSKKNYDVISMMISGSFSVNKMVLENPSRMVLDIKGAFLTSPNGSFSGKNIGQIRWAGHDDYVRIVAENDMVPSFILTNNEGVVDIKFYSENLGFDFLSDDSEKILLNEGLKATLEKNTEKEAVFKISGGQLSEENIIVSEELVEEVSVKGTKLTVSLNGKCDIKIDGSKIIFTKTKDENNNDYYEDDDEDEKIVVLDAGHGGTDPGTLGYDSDGETIIAYEKDMNLAITLMVRDILLENGIKTYLTRSKDVFIGLSERALFAEEKNADIFVSIHNNSIPDPTYKGSMVLYHTSSMAGKKLAQNILDAMTLSAKTEDKGLRDGSNMAVIKKTSMPAVIVECGCLTNEEELSNLMDEEFLEKLAIGIADGILESL